MLKDYEALSSGEKSFIRKPDNDFLYRWSYFMSRISLTVFELYAESQFDRCRDAPGGENIFIRKTDSDFLLVVC
jgi:hypothetical protein